MEKPKKDEQAPKATETTPDSIRQATRRQRIKQIVYGTLLSSGTLSFGAWNAQAHGNRSSHPGVGGCSGGCHFSIEDDGESDLGQLLAVDTQTGGAPAGGRQPASAVEFFSSIATHTDWVRLMEGLRRPQTEEASEPLDAPGARASDIEARLDIEPRTKRLLGLLAEGRENEAIAILEDPESASTTLATYLFTQLELYRLSHFEGLSTPAMANQIAIISRAAERYSASLPQTNRALQRTQAAILHNFASFMLPETGRAPAELVAEGDAAARKALALRAELSEPGPLVNARIMAGSYDHDAGLLDDAERQFRMALGIAESSSDANGAAWAQVYLARTLLARGDASEAAVAEELLASARQTLEGDALAMSLMERVLN